MDVREAVETLEEWALGTLKGDERPQGEDWTNHCIDTTAGTAIEGIIGVAAGETGGPEDRDAAFAALGRLWNASPAMRNHVATLCTNNLAVLAQRGGEWVRAHLVNAVEDEGSEELRRLLSERLENVSRLFGQLPDTLEDVWVRVALGEIEEAKRTIDAVPDEHPFALRYREEVRRVDWESCARVLADDARRRSLSRGWRER